MSKAIKSKRAVAMQAAMFEDMYVPQTRKDFSSTKEKVIDKKPYLKLAIGFTDIENHKIYIRCRRGNKL